MALSLTCSQNCGLQEGSPGLFQVVDIVPSEMTGKEHQVHHIPDILVSRFNG